MKNKGSDLITLLDLAYKSPYVCSTDYFTKLILQHNRKPKIPVSTPPDPEKTAKRISTKLKRIKVPKPSIEDFDKENSKENQKESKKVLSSPEIKQLVERLTAIKKKPVEEPKPEKPKLYSIRRIDGDLYQKLGKKNSSNQIFLTKKDYLVSKKLPSDSKLFFFNSNDHWIKSELLASGFCQVSEKHIKFADVIYTFSDSSTNYREISPEVYFNHFENNQCVTSKQGLTKVMNSSGADFYPQTVDLTDKSNIDIITEQYFKKSMLTLLEKNVKYFKLRIGEKMRIFKKGVLKSLSSSQRKAKFELFDANFATKVVKMIGAPVENFIVNYVHLEQLLYYLRTLFKDFVGINDQVRRVSHLKLHAETISAMEAYAELSIPYESHSKEVLTSVGFSDEFWKTPSDFLVFELYLYYQFFKQNGVLALSRKPLHWILKPCSKSKGVGITICDSNEGVRKHIEKNPYCVAQRYITNPFLALSGHKFDIRVWVLVSSIEPLRVAFFPEFYLRLCSEKFDRENLSNLKAHLTNFSVNKAKFEDKAESVRSREYLESLLSSKGVSFSDVILPQIQNICWGGIEAARNELIGRPKSFQVFGFDMLIDDNMKVWLLEINQSPNCEIRTEFLRANTQKMAKSLFEHLKIVQADSAETKWEELNPGESAPEEPLDSFCQLLVTGSAFNLAKEAAVDKSLKREFSAMKIVRFFRSIKRRPRPSVGLIAND